MKKPSFFGGLWLCPWLWVLYQLVFVSDPAYFLLLAAFAGIMSAINNGSNALMKVDCALQTGVEEPHIGIPPDEFDELDLEDEVDDPSVDGVWEVEVDENLMPGAMSDDAFKKPGYDGEPLHGRENPLLVAPSSLPVPDGDWELLDHPDDYLSRGDPSTVNALGQAYQQPLEGLLEQDQSQSPAGEDPPMVTSSSLLVPEGDCELLDTPDDCLSSRDPSAVVEAFEPSPQRRVELSCSVGGVRMRQNPPKIRLIDVPKPKFIETYLISVPEGDSPIPTSEFLYNYRNFYFRHRGNWREMKSKEVFKPGLGDIEEDSRPYESVGMVTDVVVGGSPQRERKARKKSKDGKLRRRGRKFFAKWKAAADLLLML